MTTAVFLVIAIAMAACRHAIAHFLLVTGSPARDAWLLRHTASLPLIQTLYPTGQVNWLARLSPSFLFLSIALTALLLPLMLFLDSRLPTVSAPAERAVRRIADGTFALYCFHAPLLILLFTLAGHPAMTWVGISVAFVLPVLGSVVISGPLDRLKNQMRGALNRSAGIPRSPRRSPTSATP